MTTIRHRFFDHTINLQTETLVIGTFNPDTPENTADFFYGRPRNFLWKLIPTAFGDSNLKSKTKDEKLDFIIKRKLDFIDLIAEVEVDEVSNYYDNYLDSRVSKWRDIISEINKLSNIKRVCFTRKSFSDIPNMKIKIEAIREYCETKIINFQYLTTPARFYREDKQHEWTNFFNYGN
jgi:G:T/U-mismatch repair DNA glycosylase